MCGIAGIVERRGRVDREELEAMGRALAHRGPDDAGCWISPDGRVGLAHRRLAFLDLTSAGHEPMRDESGRRWLVFNGEIYNYLELTRELEARGHRFASRSDGEVLLHGWEEWGDGLLERIDGMFAFALWDDETRTLLLARDRFGIKPLYVADGPERLLFASEARGILAHPAVEREIDWSAVCDYLVYRYVPSPRSVWRGLAKLEPAESLELVGDRPARRRFYWRLPEGARRPSRAEASERLEALLRDSVRRHLVADVPVGAFLSGGYDSSALALEASRLGYRAETYSIGFEDWPESEHRYAAEVAAHCGLGHRAWVLGRESLALAPRMADVYDEPLADISTLPTFAVSFLAAGRVKAVLSGEGADELLGGYTWQHDRARREDAGERVDPVAHYAAAMAMGAFDREGLAALLDPGLHEALPEDPHWFYRRHLRSELAAVAQVQALDLRTFLGELVLTKVDRATMACSLEARVPFLDRALVEELWTLAPDVRFRTGEQKPLLRALLEGHLPARILARPKQGFVGPDEYYSNLDVYRRILAGSRLAADGIVRPGAVESLLAAGDVWRLWKVGVLELWYRRWGCGA